MPKVYTLYLSTQTPAGSQYAPVDATNKACVKWSINWDQLYGSVKSDVDERIARVSFQISSLAQDGIYTYVSNSGILAIQGISNKFSNSQNGLVLGTVVAIDNPVAGHPSHILTGDTLQTRGVTTVMPFGYQDINVLLLNRAGELMPNVLDYQLILQFEME
jgi:hypothetical protein